MFPGTLVDVILSWKLVQGLEKAKTLWNVMGLVVCWAIWLERNNRIFDNHAEPTHVVYRKVKDFCCFWASNCKEFDSILAVDIKRGWGQVFRILPSV